jgi:hypothetical protein
MGQDAVQVSAFTAKLLAKHQVSVHTNGYHNLAMRVAWVNWRRLTRMPRLLAGSPRNVSSATERGCVKANKLVGGAAGQLALGPGPESASGPARK